MTKISAISFGVGAALALGLGAAHAQQASVPERRAVVVENMDFYGGDLDPVFDVSFERCQNTCLENAECTAFTYNTKASACFPKAGFEEMRAFDGALSARIVETHAKTISLIEQREAELGFLPRGYLKEAHELARLIGAEYPLNEREVEPLLTSARDADKRKEPRTAAKLYAAALNVTDAADNWGDLSRAYASVNTGDWRERRDLQIRASAAAVNGYLRAETKAQRATALNQIATTLETRSQGRRMIPTLRLSQELAPRDETQKALDRAISNYGFRITGHTVDSNAVQPRICITFSEQVTAADVDYGDYIRLQGKDLPVEADGNQICIDGVEHGKRYEFTVRGGLPSSKGEKLNRATELDVYVRDRNPAVRFTGSAYVLPKSANAAIPVVTVNADEVALRIHRVGERNLRAASQRNLLGSGLDTYEEGEIASDLGEPVWKGTGETEKRLNEDVTTALPIGDAITEFEPGVYVMTARVGQSDDWQDAATQWFVVTDLGLTTLTGADGLHVFARSLASADPVAGAEVELIAANNEVLGKATTDEDGYVRFAPGLTRGDGGSAPALLTIEGEAGDFAFLDLTTGSFDLSDRGVEGRRAPGPLDVYATTERGAYRPGEMVHATILARDAQAKAVTDVPLTAVLTRPDGVEHLRKVLPDEGAGGRALSTQLGNNVPRGSWSLAVYADPKKGSLAYTSFLVEDFVPERIDFDLTAPEGSISLGDVPEIALNAQYLYGAPAADMAIEGLARVSAVSALEGQKGYSFGLHDERVDAKVETLPEGLTTDENGNATIPLALPAMEPVTKPLQLTAVIRVRDSSGRPVERSLTTPLSPDGPMIGIKSLFEGSVEEGAKARFEVIAVDEDGARTGFDGVQWEVNRVTTRYQWYEAGGSWRYEPITTRTRVASGTLDLEEAKPATVEAAIDWGRHELKIVKTEGDYAASSVGFYAGWYRPVAGSDTPDTLEVSLDKKAYKIGDTAKLHVEARFPGKLLVAAMDNRLIHMEAIAVEKGETIIDVPVTEEWGPGVYLMATLIRPMDAEAGRNPSRAIGVHYAPIDPAERELGVAFTTPDEVDPRGPMLAALKIEGLNPGESAWATIAAVDVGVLNVTGFEPPEPEDYYFGQRRLGMDIRDLYGRLIDGSLGNPGRLRSGGDGPGASSPAPPPNEHLVAFFSGVVEANEDGVVEATFDMPDFNGTVKLMGIAWTDTGVGSASKDILVRDPIVVSVSVPRFLAPDDQSRVLIEVAHATGPAGDVKVSLRTGDLLTLDGKDHTLTLAEKEKQSLLIPVTAGEVGDPEIAIVTTTPSGKELTKTVRLAIRANDPEIVRRNDIPLAASGGTLTVNEGTFAGFREGTARATLAVGPLARFDVPGLLQSLDRYPYGCTEQTTSKAFPLLYFDEVASALDLTTRAKLDERIAGAVRRVMASQSTSGSFGLWYASSGDFWLDAYVTDFLSQAQAKGFDVPDAAMESALSNLKNRIAYAGEFEDGGEDIAYALMVLAREGSASIGDLRYFADAKANQLGTPLAKAQLGAALAFYGEQRRADAMFRLAVKHVEAKEQQRPFWRADYGTNLRDAAGVLALSVNAGSETVNRGRLTDVVAPTGAAKRLTSTQEKVWMLLAAHALIEDTTRGTITLDGAPVDGPLVKLFEADTLAGGEVIVANTGDDKIDAVLTTFGVPSEPPVAGGNGYEISRAYYTMEGEEIAPDAVPQNTRLVAVLTVKATVGEGRLMVDDPLPAGFEIDNPNLLRAGDIAGLDWLDVRATQHAEFRTDRFLAAVNSRKDETFQLAYIVRAVSPGNFYHPAASVEDMYRPEYRANTDAGRVEVLGPVR